MTRADPSAAADRVTIALCTRNGARHLAAQLQSYLAQDHAAWDLWVSDDGSTDGTRAILAEFAAAEGHRRAVRVVEGPRAGAAANYLGLLCHPEFPAGPVALSDQDDVWMPDKLSRALARLAGAGKVALWGAQSLHADAGLRVIGRSDPPRRPPSLPNALVQNIVSGHSATLSAGALAVVRRAGVPRGVPYHDWWLYLLISAAGGAVVVEDRPVLYYRQHGGNAMGAHQGLRARLRRLGQAASHTYGDWVRANVAALAALSAMLPAESRALLGALQALPPRGLARARGFRRLGLHRQSPAGTAGLYLLAAAGRV